jgi:hypothetical protein
VLPLPSPSPPLPAPSWRLAPARVRAPPAMTLHHRGACVHDDREVDGQVVDRLIGCLRAVFCERKRRRHARHLAVSDAPTHCPPPGDYLPPTVRPSTTASGHHSTSRYTPCMCTPVHHPSPTAPLTLCEGSVTPWRSPTAAHGALAPPPVHHKCVNALPRPPTRPTRAPARSMAALARSLAPPPRHYGPPALECSLSPLRVGSLSPSPPSASTSTAQATKRGQVCVCLQGVCWTSVRSQAMCSTHTGLQRGPLHGALT